MISVNSGEPKRVVQGNQPPGVAENLVKISLPLCFLPVFAQYRQRSRISAATRYRLSVTVFTSNPALALALEERGYLEPTPVQAAIAAPETSGRDLLGSAQTGSGKTVAYGGGRRPNCR
jgi:hypothetical protein